MKRLRVKGFSMIELLVVLLIIGILAAVAAPLFLQNTDRARASEAVAAMGSIREAQRTYRSQFGSYITNIVDGTIYFGSTGAQRDLLGVNIHGAKYFSPGSYTISTTSAGGAITNPLDFVILANGANSVALTSGSATDDGARNNTDVASLQVQMDNSGATYYKVGAGSWTSY